VILYGGVYFALKRYLPDSLEGLTTLCLHLFKLRKIGIPGFSALILVVGPHSVD
jgi:hypothetical protein